MTFLRSFLLLILLSSISQFASAQANTILLYGNGAIDSQRLTNTNTSTYMFALGLGYQWNDRWTGGLNLDWTGENTSGPANSVAVGPFVRYTVPLAGVFVLYGQLNTNYIHSTLDDIGYRGIQASLFPAIGVNLKNSFALNFSVGSLSFSSQQSTTDSQSLSSFHLGIANGAGFGLSKNFGFKRRKPL